jgi:26S proteasome regulatory subunit N7
MAAELILPIPNLTISQNLFVLSNAKLTHLHENARNQLLEGLKADGMSPIRSTSPRLTSSNTEMAPYHKSITAVLSFLPQDQELLEKMEKTN